MRFHSLEQWIQYQKCLLSGNSYTANLILQCNDPLEAKRLGYRVKVFDIDRWKEVGYNVCYTRIKEKFIQNLLLMNMLKTTSPKLLAVASNDRLWSTGIPLRDHNALKTSKWYGNGCLSDMLLKIQET